MNKFESNLVLSDGSIKKNRARIIGSQAKSAQEKLIAALKDRKDNLDLELDNLQDLSPNSTTSLVVADGKNFDPNRWVAEVQRVKIQLITTKVELDTAQATYKEWFVDEKPVSDDNA